MNLPAEELHTEELDGELMARLALEHRRLGEAVGALEALLGRLEEPGAVFAFVTHLEFVHEFCELLHFPLEDALLELVLEAGLTPSERRVVFVNLAQHQQIYADALRVLEWVAADSAAGSAAGGELQSRAEVYVRGFRAHLEFETRHLQPLLRRHLTARNAERLQGLRRDLLATLAGKPLERVWELDAASRALATG